MQSHISYHKVDAVRVDIFVEIKGESENTWNLLLQAALAAQPDKELVQKLEAGREVAYVVEMVFADTAKAELESVEGASIVAGCHWYALE
jgi:hypothetical protein